MTSKGSDVKKNNGWITTFSVLSSEQYSGRAMFGIGLLVQVLVLCFLWLGKIESDAALWSSGSGIVLITLGKRKLNRQKRKVQTAMDLYPYWKK